MVGGDTAKTLIYTRLALDYRDGPGVMHFPLSYDKEYFRSLTGEKVVMKKDQSGFMYRQWKRIRRNEALDIRVYSLCALGILKPNMEKLKDLGPIAAKSPTAKRINRLRRTRGVQI